MCTEAVMVRRFKVHICHQMFFAGFQVVSRGVDQVHRRESIEVRQEVDGAAQLGASTYRTSLFVF
jgi:hypothetical protein